MPSPICTLWRVQSSLPRVAQPSMWQSMIPKPFRKGADGSRPIGAVRTQRWNPATTYIILALLVGSQAIQLMQIRHSTANITRETEAKLALLRGVIEKVKAGEDVDVEGLLGTGNREKEKEWEKFMKDIEEEDMRLSTHKEKRRNSDRIDDLKNPEEEQVIVTPKTSVAEEKNRPARFV
ncbi:hypothetical protein EJ05DRAFT_518016 [Pseudovirgaria hyperparasitica]|uniref:Uncharacterized protein n=1 Tax=Pseudovirgaria hyperparasitica TaxID=470096 RepID=A0A6A6W4T2_9PEZI|nr:uncharacterized protein EJ05DRAFT_518016 [Pseudovirgaria hyperparasitica]KAF2756567.1 hypothetical protein EJ05DRAFT_518016 [Pseudovirgaria hyperparasitica]